MITFKQFDIKNYRSNLVVTDQNLAKIYGFHGDNLFVLPAGERAKTFHWAQKLCRWFVDKGLQKDGLVVAVGGGSVGDTVGFAASIYKRSVKLLHVPTTLLAQIDSSIGGKTALNVGLVKNAVGTFYTADTLVDVAFLDTLPKKQWTSAQGEVLKYRMLSNKIDDVFLKGNWAEIIKSCANYKQEICNVDPFDKDQRKILNFGHTIGHAMELSKRMPHGEAVANGLYYELALAFQLGLCPKNYADKWRGEVTKLFHIRPLTKEILALTLHDKKNCNGLVGFVLPTADGFVFQNLTLQQLDNLLVNKQ